MFKVEEQLILRTNVVVSANLLLGLVFLVRQVSSPKICDLSLTWVKSCDSVPPTSGYFSVEYAVVAGHIVGNWI